MFQNFDVISERDAVAGRVERLRGWLADAGFDGMVIPRADAHQGETVAPHDARLAWATGFTGSAGTAIILAERAALCIDGRYTIQAREQTPPEVYEYVAVMETRPEEWLAGAVSEGAVIGFDPWLFTTAAVERLEAALKRKGAELRPLGENPVDLLWEDQPPAPSGAARIHSATLAGRDSAAKRTEVAEALKEDDAAATVLTQPDSIAWLLNIRGSDIARVPVVHAFAVIHASGDVDLVANPEKFSGEVREHLGNAVSLHPVDGFGAVLDKLSGTVRLDRDTCPVWVVKRVEAAGAKVAWGRDPCALPKARKTSAELDGMRAAHRRDGAAFARFLHWLDRALDTGEKLDEIMVAEKLEAFRRDTGALLDLSFDTISAAGEHAALPHYRVNRQSNRAIDSGQHGEVYLVDSGAQYADGTTDITRTLAAGPVDPEIRRRATLVLKGMIAISLARWPKGVAGAHLDALARIALWQQGLDFDHGTGHGVGAHLDVHEGPQNLSRRGTVPLEPGMILSNEPGFYKEGHYGIRIENLVIVTGPEVPPGGEREMMGFETLTLAPIDRKLIDSRLLTDAERFWLDSYHARVFTEIAPLVDQPVADWLEDACAPL